ncbi:hypothetical protein AVEN_226393-1 [Araneus ventricosus]|uniref:Uncharacterized protein n=1 Tax=Araneus ventricosus TaxID=182803 RepID=A0A4Y2IIW2_ARAVE|nr:hypothetical protein AVEN_226393-1 [Araneus ventricosus]
MAFTPWVTLPEEKTPEVHRPFQPGLPPRHNESSSSLPVTSSNSKPESELSPTPLKRRLKREVRLNNTKLNDQDRSPYDTEGGGPRADDGGRRGKRYDDFV